jgi:hypothetical protein
VVRGLEDIVGIALVRKPLPQVLHFRLEFLGNQNLVRETGERQVKVVGELSVFELVGFAQAVPYSVEICGQGGLEVGERGCADVISNDKEEESASAGKYIGK